LAGVDRQVQPGNAGDRPAEPDGRIALHDALSHGTLELNDIAFWRRRALARRRHSGRRQLRGWRAPDTRSRLVRAERRRQRTRVHFNIDPGARALSADIDGVLSSMPAPRASKARSRWPPPGQAQRRRRGRLANAVAGAAKVKADHAAAKLEQIETSYGTEDSALKLVGAGDVRFGASPLASCRAVRAPAGCRQVCCQGQQRHRAAAGVAALRALSAAAPEPPIPTQIELSAEQIMLGGRPLQNFAADVRTDARSGPSTAAIFAHRARPGCP